MEVYNVFKTPKLCPAKHLTQKANPVHLNCIYIKAMEIKVKIQINLFSEEKFKKLNDIQSIKQQQE
jgi:hypothetical protein